MVVETKVSSLLGKTTSANKQGVMIALVPPKSVCNELKKISDEDVFRVAQITKSNVHVRDIFIRYFL